LTDNAAASPAACGQPTNTCPPSLDSLPRGPIPGKRCLTSQASPRRRCHCPARRSAAWSSSALPSPTRWAVSGSALRSAMQRRSHPLRRSRCVCVCGAGGGGGVCVWSPRGVFHVSAFVRLTDWQAD
jgi:hypothetical protein